MKNKNSTKTVINGVEINKNVLSLLDEMSSKVGIAELKDDLFHALSMMATHSDSLELDFKLSGISQNIYFIYSFLQQIEELLDEDNSVKS